MNSMLIPTLTWYLVGCEAVLLVPWGGSDGELGEAGGGGEVQAGGREGLSDSERPVQLPQGSNYEQTMSGHSPNHLQLPLSPAMKRF